MRSWALAAPPRAVRWVAGTAGATALAFGVLLWPITNVGLAPTLLWAATVLVGTGALLGLARSRRRQRALAAAARQPLEKARITSLRPGDLARSPSVVGGGIFALLGCGLVPFVQPQRPALLLALTVALLGLGLVWVGVRRWHWAGRPETAGVPILYGLKGGRVSILAGGEAVAEYRTDRRDGNGRPSSGVLIGDIRDGGWAAVIRDGRPIAARTPLRPPGSATAEEVSNSVMQWRPLLDSVLLVAIGLVLGVGGVSELGNVAEFSAGHGVHGTVSIDRESCGRGFCTPYGTFVSVDGALVAKGVPYSGDAEVLQTLPAVYVDSARPQAFPVDGPGLLPRVGMLLLGIASCALGLAFWEGPPRRRPRRRR